MSQENNKEQKKLPDNVGMYFVAWVLGSGFLGLLFYVVKYSNPAASGF